MLNQFKRSGLAAAIAMAACAGATPALAVPIVGLTTTNGLVTFDSSAPTLLSSVAPIDGLAAGERILGIDLRPTNGLIYGVSNQNNLYTLNATTGASSFVGLLTSPSSGASFGFDFNPVADLNGAASLRIVSDTGQNLAVNAGNGATTVQTALTSGGNPIGATGAAYRDNDVDPATTAVELYFIDPESDQLYSTTAPGGGVLTADGPLGVNVTGVIGFDIAGSDNFALAALEDTGGAGLSSLYSIDLGSGQASLIGQIGIGGQAPLLAGLTVAAIPEPSTYALMLIGLAGVGFMARRRSLRDKG